MTPGNEKAGYRPQVFLDGNDPEDETLNVTVLQIVDNFGSLPSKCTIMYQPEGPTQDISGNVTLNGSGLGVLFGQRIELRDDNGCPFLGNILKRQDHGQSNQVVFTCYDDKVFLQQIPIRGAVVRQGAVTGQKFLRRFDARMNPDGYWNCVGAVSVLDGVTVVPVFAEKAQLGLVYQSPDLTVAQTLTEGVVVPWTPRFALLYLQYIASLDSSSGIPGIDATEWRSLASSTRLQWAASSVRDLVGTDVPSGLDPLDMKMPDTQLRGTRMLGAIDRILDIAGTHDIQLQYLDGVSSVQFLPIAYSALKSGTSESPAVNQLRGGTMFTTDTLFDFELSDDATQTCEFALVDGAVIHVETSMTNDISAVSSTASCNCFRNAWTDAEEASWLVGVNGIGLTGLGDFDPNQFARYPPTQGATYVDAAYSTWLLADGLAGRPLAIARTDAAKELLWQHFRNVYRAFRIDSAALASAGVMAGYLAPYSDATKYPVLSYSRPILATQLQFYLNNPVGGTAVTNWLRDVYPVRVRVQNDVGAWYEVPQAIKVRVSGDGLVWLDGIQQEMNNTPYCIWEGDMDLEPLSGPGEPGKYVDLTTGTLVLSRMRVMVVNAVVPLDHRVMGTAALDPTKTSFVSDYRNQCGGPPMFYVDSPNAFHETHQIDSQPGAITSFYGGTTPGAVVSSPLNRVLPPGSEKVFADYAASRKLFQHKLPARDGYFRLIGIRTDFRAGMWISKIVSINSPNPLDGDYLINAPIRSITHDCMSDVQVTTLGGVVGATTQY